MFRFFANLFRQLLPRKSDVSFFTRFQYRALKPTWPVALSILFLCLAFLAAGQGRAIIKYTASEASLEWGSSLSFALLTIHGVVMMYSAFILSAVTRRSYLDAQYSSDAAMPADPVDPSINLRMRYAYCCGIFLPLQFLLMSIWFQTGLFDNALWYGVLVGVLTAFVYRQCVRFAHQLVAFKLAGFNAHFATPSVLDHFAYRFWRAIGFLTDPRSSFAQSLMVGLATVLVWLSLNTSANAGELNYLTGAWMFFGVYAFQHFSYRMFRDRVIRLHHGHTARYIVIDPTIEKAFMWVRRIGLVLIPLLLWWADFVEFLGPLGVGLFGTLWITLFFSGLVESSARRARSDSAQELEREQSRFTAKSWLLIAVVTLLIVELAISVSETLLFRPALTFEIFLFAGILLVLICAPLFWPSKRRFRTAMNRLPGSVVLAPILLLSLGEAHHIHRMPSGAVADQSRALELDTHTEKWLLARGRPNQSEPVTAVIALAEGGGIRAGAQAGYYLSTLDRHLRTHCSEAPLDPLCARDADTRFSDLLFAVSGVSGGAVGSATYLATLADENRFGFEAPDDSRDDILVATLGADYLAPLFAGLFGSDLLTTVFPAQLPDRLYGLYDRKATDIPSKTIGRGVHDRADFFETRLSWNYEQALSRNKTHSASEDTGPFATQSCDQMQQCVCEDLDNCNCKFHFADGAPSLDQPVEAVARCAVANGFKDDPGPVVLFSTFYETGGYLMAASNVDIARRQIDDARSESKDVSLDQRCGNVPIVQQLMNQAKSDADEAVSHCTARDQSLPLSTAAHLSARFPGSNPTGVVETRLENGLWKRHFFVDGGYMDNSGALATLDAFTSLRHSARKYNIPVRVVVLHLHTISIPEHIADEVGIPESVPRATKQAEITTIPMAVLKARGAASKGPISLLCNSLFDYRDTPADAATAIDPCEQIFSRRVIDPAEVELKFKTSMFRDSMLPHELKFDDNRLIIPCEAGPMDRARFGAIQLNSQSPDAKGVIEAAWIPMPLEIAVHDRQRNAIPALLGWTLLEETTIAIRVAANGAAETGLNEMLRFAGSNNGFSACGRSRTDDRQTALRMP